MLLQTLLLALCGTAMAQICNNVNLQLPVEHVRSLCGPIKDAATKVDQQERSVKVLQSENTDLKKRVNSLEDAVSRLGNVSSNLQCSRNMVSQMSTVMNNFLQHFYVNGTYTVPSCKSSPQLAYVRKPNMHTGLPRDCWDVHVSGGTAGKHQLQPRGVMRPVTAWCEDGWTVIQRRKDGTQDFNLYWEDYVMGFGNIDTDHWSGSDFISFLTNQDQYTMKVEMEGFTGKLYWAAYSNFSLASEGEDYRLRVSGYSGNYKDGFTALNGLRFTTKDDDNDKASTNCAEKYRGGWWLDNCGWDLHRKICNHSSYCATYVDRYVRSSLIKVIPTAALQTNQTFLGP